MELMFSVPEMDVAKLENISHQLVDSQSYVVTTRKLISSYGTITRWKSKARSLVCPCFESFLNQALLRYGIRSRCFEYR